MLMPHSINHGNACFAYFNKIWGIPLAFGCFGFLIATLLAALLIFSKTAIGSTYAFFGAQMRPEKGV